MKARGAQSLAAAMATRGLTQCSPTRRPLLPACLILLGALLLSVSGPVTGARNSPADAPVSVQMSKASAVLTAAEWVEFDTVLRNHGAAATPPLVVHLAIAALDQGRYVDPEDWSPQRTQYLPPLQPGESVRLGWRLRALAEGAFVTFVTVVPAEESFPPAVSASLRLQVTPDNILPLKDVIPVITVVPLFPLALLVFAAAYTRRMERNTAHSGAQQMKS